MKAACPACWRPSAMTLTSRTPRVTGGSHASSTTRSRSGSVKERRKAQRGVADGVVISEQCRGVEVDGGHLGGGVPVPVLGLGEGQSASLRPARRHPDLGCAGHAGDMVVLHPGQVPHEPVDRIRLGVETGRQVVDGQAFDGLVHGVADPTAGVGEQFSACHQVLQFGVAMFGCRACETLGSWSTRGL